MCVFSNKQSIYLSTNSQQFKLFPLCFSGLEYVIQFCKSVVNDTQQHDNTFSYFSRRGRIY